MLKKGNKHPINGERKNGLHPIFWDRGRQLARGSLFSFEDSEGFSAIATFHLKTEAMNLQIQHLIAAHAAVRRKYRHRPMPRRGCGVSWLF